jgi:hypothetical protein
MINRPFLHAAWLMVKSRNWYKSSVLTVTPMLFFLPVLSLRTDFSLSSICLFVGLSYLTAISVDVGATYWCLNRDAAQLLKKVDWDAIFTEMDKIDRGKDQQ